MTYSEALDTLYSRLPFFQNQGKKAYKPDLSRTAAMLKRIGNPHEDFKSVHIAGTNGKGTSAHSLAAILQSAGYTTGLYTSPHLKSFRERIKINGNEISQNRVVTFVEDLDEIIGDMKPSFFEMTVVMAFQYFKEQQVDIAIIETGLGGRLDSTNVITPQVSLITTISMDHTDILGDTLEKIAIEKAGIVKEKIPVVIGNYQPDIHSIFEEKSKELKAPLNSNAFDYIVDFVHKEITDGNDKVYSLYGSESPNYLLKNIPGVLECINELNNLGYRIESSNVISGLNNLQSLTGLKGRFQVIGTAPKVIADVSHNQQGLTALFDQIQTMDFDTLKVVFGTVRDKNLQDLVSILPVDAIYYFTESKVARSLPAEELPRIFRHLKGRTYSDVNAAIKKAVLDSDSEDLILVTGSTFVIAEINDL